ncbi:MAG: hypothetical protein JWR22_4203 [Herminiimonas sp.]|nr:hypothetical protein [Herminiimonas sp.]
MIILRRVRNAEGDRDPVQEARCGQRHPLRREIVAGRENNFVTALLQITALQQRMVAAPVWIGGVALYERPVHAVQAIQFDGDTGAGLAKRNVQNMSADFSHEILLSKDARIVSRRREPVRPPVLNPRYHRAVLPICARLRIVGLRNPAGYAICNMRHWLAVIVVRRDGC